MRKFRLMHKENKFVIEELTKYFLEQDHAVIARALAGSMLDIHRFMTLEVLGQKEINNLIIRCKHVSKELVKFAKDGPDGPLIISIKNSEDEDE